MAKSEILFFFEVFFVVGVFIASIFYIERGAFSFFILGGSFLFLVLLLFLKKKKLVFFIFLSLLFGFFYFNLYSAWQVRNNFFLKNLKSRKSVQFTAKIISLPQKRGSLTTFLVKDLKTKSKALVSAWDSEDFEYGDIVFIEGTPSFLTSKYFFQKNVFSKIRAGKITSIGQSKDLIYFLYKVKNKLIEKIEKIFIGDQAEFYKGIIFGEKDSLSFAFKERLRRSGLMHLFALSGFNIAIISVFFLDVLIFLGLNRGAAFYPAVLLVLLFVLMTGASSSCVRAGIMGSLYLLAQKLDLLIKPKYLLAFTGFLMTVFNPKIVFFNPGFQLSFLAVFGLFYLMPLLKEKILFQEIRLTKKFGGEENLVKDIFFVSLSAQLAVLPLIVIYFKYIPLFGILANILVLPLIPFLMGFAFLVALLSFLSFKLAFVLSYFLYPVWFYFKNVVSFSSYFSFYLSWYFGLFILLIYFLFIYFWLLRKKIPVFNSYE